MKVYIAGKITGFPGYRQMFAAAEARLAELGHSVMNPAWLYAYPEFNYEDYTAVAKAMLARCDGILLLPFWTNSHGAKNELKWAEAHGLQVFDVSEDRTGVNAGWEELMRISMEQGLCGVDQQDAMAEIKAIAAEHEKLRLSRGRKGEKK